MAKPPIGTEDLNGDDFLAKPKKKGAFVSEDDTAFVSGDGDKIDSGKKREKIGIDWADKKAEREQDEKKKGPLRADRNVRDNSAVITEFSGAPADGVAAVVAAPVEAVADVAALSMEIAQQTTQLLGEGVSFLVEDGDKTQSGTATVRGAGRALDRAIEAWSRVPTEETGDPDNTHRIPGASPEKPSDHHAITEAEDALYETEVQISEINAQIARLLEIRGAALDAIPEVTDGLSDLSSQLSEVSALRSEIAAQIAMAKQGYPHNIGALLMKAKSLAGDAAAKADEVKKEAEKAYDEARREVYQEIADSYGYSKEAVETAARLHQLSPELHRMDKELERVAPDVLRELRRRDLEFAERPKVKEIEEEYRKVPQARRAQVMRDNTDVLERARAAGILTEDQYKILKEASRGTIDRADLESLRAAMESGDAERIAAARKMLVDAVEKKRVEHRDFTADYMRSLSPAELEAHLRTGKYKEWEESQKDPDPSKRKAHVYSDADIDAARRSLAERRKADPGARPTDEEMAIFKVYRGERLASVVVQMNTVLSYSREVTRELAPAARADLDKSMQRFLDAPDSEKLAAYRDTLSRLHSYGAIDDKKYTEAVQLLSGEHGALFETHLKGIKTKEQLDALLARKGEGIDRDALLQQYRPDAQKAHAKDVSEINKSQYRQTIASIQTVLASGEFKDLKEILVASGGVIPDGVKFAVNRYIETKAQVDQEGGQNADEVRSLLDDATRQLHEAVAKSRDAAIAAGGELKGGVLKAYEATHPDRYKVLREHYASQGIDIGTAGGIARIDFTQIKPLTEAEYMAIRTAMKRTRPEKGKTEWDNLTPDQQRALALNELRGFSEAGAIIGEVSRAVAMDRHMGGRHVVNEFLSLTTHEDRMAFLEKQIGLVRSGDPVQRGIAGNILKAFEGREPQLIEALEGLASRDPDVRKKYGQVFMTAMLEKSASGVTRLLQSDLDIVLDRAYKEAEKVADEKATAVYSAAISTPAMALMHAHELRRGSERDDMIVGSGLGEDLEERARKTYSEAFETAFSLQLRRAAAESPQIAAMLKEADAASRSAFRDQLRAENARRLEEAKTRADQLRAEGKPDEAAAVERNAKKAAAMALLLGRNSDAGAVADRAAREKAEQIKKGASDTHYIGFAGGNRAILETIAKVEELNRADSPEEHQRIRAQYPEVSDYTVHLVNELMKPENSGNSIQRMRFIEELRAEVGQNPATQEELEILSHTLSSAATMADIKKSMGALTTQTGVAAAADQQRAKREETARADSTDGGTASGDFATGTTGTTSRVGNVLAELRSVTRAEDLPRVALGTSNPTILAAVEAIRASATYQRVDAEMLQQQGRGALDTKSVVAQTAVLHQLLSVTGTTTQTATAALIAPSEAIKAAEAARTPLLEARNVAAATLTLAAQLQEQSVAAARALGNTSSPAALQNIQATQLAEQLKTLLAKPEMARVDLVKLGDALLDPARAPAATEFVKQLAAARDPQAMERAIGTAGRDFRKPEVAGPVADKAPTEVRPVVAVVAGSERTAPEKAGPRTEPAKPDPAVAATRDKPPADKPAVVVADTGRTGGPARPIDPKGEAVRPAVEPVVTATGPRGDKPEPGRRAGAPVDGTPVRATPAVEGTAPTPRSAGPTAPDADKPAVTAASLLERRVVGSAVMPRSAEATRGERDGVPPVRTTDSAPVAPGRREAETAERERLAAERGERERRDREGAPRERVPLAFRPPVTVSRDEPPKLDLPEIRDASPLLTLTSGPARGIGPIRDPKVTGSESLLIRASHPIGDPVDILRGSGSPGHIGIGGAPRATETTPEKAAEGPPKEPLRAADAGAVERPKPEAEPVRLKVADATEVVAPSVPGKKPEGPAAGPRVG